jgi:hypothetical protein
LIPQLSEPRVKFFGGVDFDHVCTIVNSRKTVNSG